MKNPNKKDERLLTTERIYVGRPINYVVMMARISGFVTKNSLSNALNTLKDYHRLLKSRIEIKENSRAYFAFDQIPEFSIEEIKKTNDKEWIYVAEEHHMKEIDIFEGPLIRFSLLQANTSTDLIICSHHS
ncbi:MAG: hypothetical protein GF364_08935, partial [Candidatus Lokiarchaeota archaeon]|nr:hypothetical protein [Candidatus Lokiarchaeota archaeon]